MMFCFRNILQIWIIFIGFRDMNDFVNLGICKHDFKFTCRGYCRFTLNCIIYNDACHQIFMCFSSGDMSSHAHISSGPNSFSNHIKIAQYDYKTKLELQFSLIRNLFL